MPAEQAGRRAIAARGPLNLAELVEQGLVELTELCLADAAALLAVELELLEQLARIDEQQADALSARERLLGYTVEPGVGDLHDLVERRLVTEYLQATGVDAVVTPLVKKAPLYSHVARDASLVAIAGEIAPEAIVHRLTSCPRVLLYGLDGEGLELRGRLWRRVVAAGSPGWPERPLLLKDGPAVAEPEDLRKLLGRLERGEALPTVSEEVPAPARSQPTAAERRRARRMRLNGIE